MRIVFCGTPEFAVPTLRELLAHPDFSVEAVVTQPDRPRGRGQAVTSSPVKEVALGADIYVYQPETTKSDSAYDFFKRVAPEAVVIIAYGQIVPARLIAIPPLGWINLHGSLLPKYRGAAPIAWAIANGETATGLTTMQIDAGMDTGPILLQQTMAIGTDETAPELARRMAQAGAALVIESLAKLGRGEVSGRAQDSSDLPGATYAPRLEKKHGRIDWSQSAGQIYNRMRGFAPWPGTYSTFRGQLCHLWGRPADRGVAANAGATPGTLLAGGGGLRVVCGESSTIELTEVQLEGRKRTTAGEFANGAHLAPGERFGD
ncbi:MAG TPA: methionyl-tRNA formyltransferase [Candidatus Acidoferrales bacterium]|jgi:methionyl-tRNA formyltransferase